MHHAVSHGIPTDPTRSVPNRSSSKSPARDAARKASTTRRCAARFAACATGGITAAGGAWNASIVAEIVSYGNHTLVAIGLGAYIAPSTAAGNFARTLVGISVMSVYVVGLNRLVWRRLYRLAETRYFLQQTDLRAPCRRTRRTIACARVLRQEVARCDLVKRGGRYGCGLGLVWLLFGGAGPVLWRR